MTCYLDELKLNIKDCDCDLPCIETQGLVQDEECGYDSYDYGTNEYMKECSDGLCSMSEHSMPSFMSYDNSSSNFSGIRTDTSDYTYQTLPDSEKTLKAMECYQECLKLEKECPGQVKCKKPPDEDVCYNKCLRLKRLCPDSVECIPKKSKTEPVTSNDNKPTNYIYDDPEEQNDDVIPDLNNHFETDTVTSFDNFTLPGHIDSEYESLVQDCSTISEQNSTNDSSTSNSFNGQNISSTDNPVHTDTTATKEEDTLYSECLSFKKVLEQHGCSNVIECHNK